MNSANKLFNASIAAHIVSCADQIGIFDTFRNKKSVSIEDLNEQFQNQKALQIIIDVLKEIEILEEEGDGLISGAKFDEYDSRRSLFTWMLSASSAVVLEAPSLTTDTTHMIPHRDSALIGRTMGDLGRVEIDRRLKELNVWKETSSVLDIGCGDGSRLIDLSSHFDIIGYGIDVKPSKNWDQTRIVDPSRTHSVEFFVGDANSLSETGLPFSEIECVMMALMGHDLLPYSSAISTLSSWRELFPKLKNFILVETHSVASVTLELTEPVPSLGYEYLHSLMRTPLETHHGWMEILKKVGYSVDALISVSVPGNTMIYVCSPKR